MRRAVIALAAFVSLVAVPPAGAQQPVSQLDVNAVPRLNSDGVRRVQTLLRQKGFEAGKIDGVPGPITRAAVVAFQARFGMKASGEMDNQFLLGLGAVDLAGTNE
jgi:peptidoglycan hydrolase-like protein with peptidoglycan-binding domain